MKVQQRVRNTISVSIPGIAALKRIELYMRQNPDLTIASLFALTTTIAVPVSPEQLVGSINAPLLATLFCLMAIIAGFRRGGVLTYAYGRLFSGAVSARRLVQFFVFSCFFFSMAVTNDVSLIIFVPLAIAVLSAAGMEDRLLFVLTFQTIAANMGSILTPIGNPQNLFIYSYYQMNLAEFLSITGPLTAFSGLLLWAVTYYIPKTAVSVPDGDAPTMGRRKGLVFALLFGVCILAVLRLITPLMMFLIVCPALLLADKRVFRDVDYKLLLLFVFLFIGVGNIGRLPIMAAGPAQLLQGHEFMLSLLLSQVLSNVPTVVLLAPYTDAARELLLGVNVGGLGTIIASMASIISFKAYLGTAHCRPLRYLAFFTAANVVFLAAVLAMESVFI